MARQPDETSRTTQVRRFFETNPDEYLTLDDVAAKFGCTKQQAQHVVGKLRDAGVVESVYLIRKAPVAR